ncbi:MAG TPA: SRPBCC family protein [Dehalococcoidia bacterium]|nr:SRPBCC family protein [Dehalococcoidia bacterium]
MPAVEVRTFIPAPPEAVWETIADLEAQPRWMSDVVELRVTSPQRQGVGVTMAITSRFLFKTIREVATVTTWDPPRRLAVRHSGDFSGVGIFTLEPAPGGTVFVWREEVRPPFGPLGLAVFPLLKPRLARLFARNSDRLREIVLARTREAQAEPKERPARSSRARARGKAETSSPPPSPED